MLRFVICCMHTSLNLAPKAAIIRKTSVWRKEVFDTDVTYSAGIDIHAGRREGHE